MTFLPFGWTEISIPVSKIFSLSVNDSEPFPPGNNVSKISEKCTDIELNEDSILNSISFSISFMCDTNSLLANLRSSIFFVISTNLSFSVSKSSLAK